MQTEPGVPAIALDRLTASQPQGPQPQALTKAAFHALMVAALPGLRQQALALTRNRPDADDLVQAAVTNALAAQSTFSPETNFRAWMSRILRNRFFSNIRARRETVQLDDAPPARLARGGGQEEHVAMQELRRCMARLRPDHRLVLLMIAVQGLSYEEASAELGIAIGTLKCRVFRARRQLKAWMLDDAPDNSLSRSQPPRSIVTPAAPCTGPLPGTA